MLVEAPPVDAAIIAAFGDPGLAAARGVFDFPVVGMAEAAIVTAVQLGQRFAIVTFTPAMTPSYRASVTAHGLGARCLGLITPADSGVQLPVRRRMTWNRRSDFGAESSGSSGSGYAA